MNVLPIWKSHYSIGKSILTLDKPSDSLEQYPLSIFSIAKYHKLDSICLSEDSISGILEAAKFAAELKIKLIFGLRVSITDGENSKTDGFEKKQSKYIIFCKNNKGYKDLIKISTWASTNGFYYHPSIDFDNLKKLWTDNLLLSVPFYDSFLHLNTLESRNHVPDFSFTTPSFFIEENNLPFDSIIKEKVVSYCEKNKFNYIQSQSIYYYSPEDYIAYITFRCINSRGFTKKSTCERPELNHMCSDKFNFLKLLKDKNG